ncbi:MAG: hypothetical protein QE274_12580 [Verrucomicrobiaceae bacterium]|nr:hypothetical protein [Verrucomicrobiaceae bacterium]
MKRALTVACIILKSAWQAVALRSALAALLLAPLALHADDAPARQTPWHLGPPKTERLLLAPCAVMMDGVVISNMLLSKLNIAEKK